jgi:putative ABC transport system ATP-binding protein
MSTMRETMSFDDPFSRPSGAIPPEDHPDEEPALPLIRLEEITKLYRTTELETSALDGIDLKIERGEFVAVMGPSGCGKSTLLNIVGLIDTPTSGRYWFADREVARLSENKLADLRKGNVGFIFQSFNLIDELNVYENVELPLLYQGIPKAQRRNLVREALELVGLSARAKHKPDQLSGGQQQRVAVARAVVGDPKLILADEPTGNLDSKNGEEVMAMLKILNDQGATILMVTHSPSHAERADRIVNLLDGRIVAPEQLEI